MSPIDWSLYLVTDPGLAGGRDNVADIAVAACRGGATVVQLRDKDASDAELLLYARRLQEQLGKVPLFINDRVELAAELGCHLHVGQDDHSVAEARALLADDALVGLSVGSEEELDAALSATGAARPDVLGIGPVFSTATKANAPAGIGVEAAARLAGRAAAAGMPAVAIGGLKAHNVAELKGSAFAGVCVVSAIMAAEDPASAASELVAAFRH
ncbi:thiamine phosphate synthase [Corynebacterium confusum]|uniref:thiamine phosphate synthase n=1 Tax=Corynebacterium confusum TaxID=71254 RepID=UPI0025B3014D|nr:thiamine phosphate synthase [Corynebacterium confusum]WJY89714.1 Thiamine-phosphate synthase [Corynebacterium confusum]